MLFKFCIILSLAFLPYIAASFDNCRSTCESTYSIHTNDQVGELRACLFGCRLSYIIDLATSDNNVANTCTTDCKEVYQEASLLTSCTSGCKWQPKRSLVQDESDPFALLWHHQLIQPIHMVRSYCSGMFQHASQIFIASTVSDTESSDGVNSFVLHFQISPVQAIEDADKRSEEPFNNIAAFDNAVADNDAGESSSYYLHRAYHHGHKWLNCVEKQVGVPYWALVSLLFLSLFFLLWICCSTCEEEKSSDTKNHKFGSKDLSIRCEGEPLFLVKCSDDQAGPLPEKEKLLLA